MVRLGTRNIDGAAGHVRHRVAELGGDIVAKGSPALLALERRRADRLGIRRACFVLTFDCDTDRDLDVVPEVHERLARAGVVPGYAVPGELLEAGFDVYDPIRRSGAELLNHGHARHCAIDPSTGSYVSWHFYDQLSWDAVEEDVRAGHADHLRLFGVAPVGFRAPHFGTVGRARRARIHRLLTALGYRYSSSTLPVRQLLGGPLLRAGGSLVEIPVTGRPSAPTRVLDSWSFRYAPHRRVGDSEYERDLVRAIDELLDGRRRVLNIYADPSQVADWPPFFEQVSRAAPVALPSLSALAELAVR